MKSDLIYYISSLTKADNESIPSQLVLLPSLVIVNQNEEWIIKEIVDHFLDYHKL
jgi:hypothetical protein